MESLLTIKQIGLAVVAFSIMILATIFILVEEIRELNSIVCQNYSLPASLYPYINNIPFPAMIGIIIDISLAIFGIFLIVSERHTQRVKTETKDRWKKNLKDLSGEDKLLFELIGNSGGAIYQSQLVEKSGMNKVRVTRILDKLELQGLIERKRRGMTNLVTLKS
jgi:uncharacterized membrane protein